MAGLPNVAIVLGNGGLGGTGGTDDSVSGLIMSGIAVAGKIALLEPKQIFSLDEAEELGLDAAYDTTNTFKVYEHIKDFYSQADTGTELWIMLVSNATLMVAIADIANDFAKKLLNTASGRVKLLGITRTPPLAYAPTITAGIDPDVISAIAKAQELAEDFADNFQPVRVLLEGRGVTDITALPDLAQRTDNRVGVLIANSGGGSYASIGLLLGRAAANSVQEDVGKVKLGDLGIENAYLSTGNALSTYSIGQITSLHNKGYMLFRKFTNTNGYFVNKGQMATGPTDDYQSLANGRVIDKALVLCYQTYVTEILDDIEIDSNGRIEAGVIKLYQANIERVIFQQMQSLGEISGVRCTVDPNQNVLSTRKVVIKVAIRPKGYSEFIEVQLGFENPAL